MTQTATAALTERRPGHGLAPAAYGDPGLFNWERTEVLQAGWTAVARAADLAEPGQYRALTVAGEPILVVRDQQGTLRALSNVCRHRAMLMLDGRGKVGTISCPYHRWTYRLDGRLQAAPHMGDVPGFDPARCALPGLRVAEALGFVFVTFDPAAPPLDGLLAPMVAKIEAEVPDVSTWVTASVTEFASPFDWKVIMENTIESYHNIGPHARTLNGRWPGQRSMPQPGPDHLVELRHNRDPEQGTFTVWAAFPTFALVVQDPPLFALWYDLEIRGYRDCLMHLTVLMPPATAANAGLVAAVTATLRAIHQEDVEACAAVQRGLSARLATVGPLATLEVPIARFHDWLAARASRAAAA